MSFNILLVEDNIQKKDKILDFIKSIDSMNIVAIASSFTSGCQIVDNYGSECDIILLDISLPTYDKNNLSPGGNFRSFAGKEIARKIIRKKMKMKIIFITQYNSFSENRKSYNFQELKAELIKDCKDNFLGMIQFDSTKENWKIDLNKLIGDLS